MDRTAGERNSNSRKTRPEIVTGTGPIYGQLRAYRTCCPRDNLEGLAS